MAISTKSIKNQQFASRRRGSTAARRRPAVDSAAVAVSRSPIPTATGVALRLGWIERELAFDGTSLTILDDSEAASLPGLLRDGDNVSALWTRSAGSETRLIGLTSVDAFGAVLAAPDADVADLGWLAGRRLALPRHASDGIDVARVAALRGFHTATCLAGLFGDEVAYVDVPAAPKQQEPYAAELAALLRGDVDAVYVAGAHGIAAASQIGATEVVNLGAQLDPTVRVGATSPAALTVDAQLLAHEPTLVVRVLATLLRAGVWAQAHPAEARRIVAAETHATVHEVSPAHGAGFHERLHVDLSERKLTALRAQHDFLRTYGFLPRDVDLGAWVDPRPLAAARELLAAERTVWG